MSATLVHPDGWYPASWRRQPARQMPAYADAAALGAVEARLAQARAGDRHRRRGAAARARWPSWSSGGGFLLQGGDCAESFDDPVAEQVAGIVGLFDAMADAARARSSAGRWSRWRGSPANSPSRAAPTSKRMTALTPARLSRRHRQRRRVRRGRARGRPAADDPRPHAVGRHRRQPRRRARDPARRSSPATKRCCCPMRKR